MVLRKLTVDNSARYVPISEKAKKADSKPKKNKSWFTSSQTKQKYFTIQ